jgi:hypothetical protein
VCNVKEEQLAKADDPLVAQVRERAQKSGAAGGGHLRAIEAEIMQLPEEERADFLDSVGPRGAGPQR